MTTAKNLMDALSKLPPDTRILTRGYEGGYENVILPKKKFIKEYEDGALSCEYYGPIDIADEDSDKIDVFNGVVL